MCGVLCSLTESIHLPGLLASSTLKPPLYLCCGLRKGNARARVAHA